MNVKKFFELANAAGITESEIVTNKVRSLSITVFRNEVENFAISTSFNINARGVYNGKMGFASSEKDDKDTASYLVDTIKLGASLSESSDPALIFKGSPKYKKKNKYNKEIMEISERDKIDTLFKIEKALKDYDPRVTDVMVQYGENVVNSTLNNSYGLKLGTKQSYFYFVSQVFVKDENDVKTGYGMYLGDKPSDFDVDKFVKKAAKDALDKLGGKSTKSGIYKTIINPRVTASLLNFYLRNVNAENVQKQSSLFINKLNEQVASKLVTIYDAPLTNNVFYSYYDDEGVAKYNKPIIEKGVLKTYLYNLSTALKDGVETTGNAVVTNGKVAIAPSQVVLKPGKKDFNALLALVGDGFYLTEVQGLHAGLNPTSGDFSLQAGGFRIRDGKLAEPLALITVAGNLVNLFKDVVAVGNENELQLSGYTTSSVVIKGLAVSGE
jgi:PmbA protein